MDDNECRCVYVGETPDPRGGSHPTYSLADDCPIHTMIRELICPRCGEPTIGHPDPEAPEYATDVCPECDREMETNNKIGRMA
jgi:hypothetical protein